MPRVLIGLLLLLTAETAALACSCVLESRSPQEARALARSLAQNAVALVEVELVAPYDERRGVGERLRVRRILAGRAFASFFVERDGTPSSAACDVGFPPGQRTVILLYAPRQRQTPAVRRYRISNSCTTYLLDDPTIRATIAAEIRRR